MKRIWLVGGTQESVRLAIAIANLQIPCIISVTTESAITLYRSIPNPFIWVGKLTAQELPQFLQTHSIAAILDASHPFATEISKLAIASTLPYLRWERSQTSSDSNARSIPSFEALLQTDWLMQRRALLTIGYRSLPLFRNWHDRSTLFARILPSIDALTAAIEAGFTADRLIALRPPIGMELERSLWQHWAIDTIVTKASGAPGGEEVKRQLAQELGVQLIVIDRPAIEYPRQTEDLEQALEFCRIKSLESTL